MIKFSSSLYDKLKLISQIILPALGILYFSLSGIWGLPSAEAVVVSILAVVTFFGVILQIASLNYSKSGSDNKYDGYIVVTPKIDGGKLYSIELPGDPEEIDKKGEVLLKVSKPNRSARRKRGGA